MKTTEMNFAIGATKYNRTINGYLYKRGENDEKWTRIGKAEWEQAFDEFLQTSADVASVDEWENEANAEREAREARASESDKAAEKAMSKTKKASKPRKSKDIAFKTTVALADDKIADVTLTAKQVDFVKALPKCCFYENGVDSILWCDCIAMDISWNPMSVGAMISTLREKDLVNVNRDDSRQGKPKFMTFTELGKEVAKKLGLN